MLANDMADKPEIERKLPKSFSMIHELITKVLKSNGVLQEPKSQVNDSQIQLVVQKVMKL
jgi:hypothetical protein